MMSTAQPASTPMIIELLQLVGVEELVLVVTILLALAFSGVFPNKQSGSSKSPKSLELSPRHAKQTVVSKSTELKPTQESQPMPSPSSGGCGEELAKDTSRDRWFAQRVLQKNAPIVSSGDLIKDKLVAKIKSFQASGKDEKLAWWSFCESQGNKRFPVRDPARYPVDVLQQFVQDHCSSETEFLQRQIRRSQRFHEKDEKGDPETSLSQKVELLVDCASRRQDADVIAIFEEIQKNAENTAFTQALKQGKHLPVDVFNMLVQCAGRIGRRELIKVLFEDMTRAGIKRPLAFYKSTMKMLVSKRYCKEGMYVYSCLEADGLEPTPVMLSCLVSFAGDTGDSKRAISFFNSLSACSIPAFRDYTVILHMHSKDNNWPASVALLREMQDRQAPMDSLALNLALSTGVAAGQLEAAKTLLQEFSSIADVVSYNTIMNGLAQQKSGVQAIALLDEMCKVGVKPSVISFNTAIDAAVRSLRVTDAWQVLARMKEAGLTPDKITRTVLMKGLHCGATSEQLAVLLDLTQNATQDCKSSDCAKMFRSVIKAIVYVNDPDLAARAIAQMIDQLVMLPPQEYQTLLQVLSFDKDGNSLEHSQKTLTELHAIGKCSPCAFIHQKNGCQLGPACPRCHMCPAGALHKSFDSNKAVMRARLVKARADVTMAKEAYM